MSAPPGTQLPGAPASTQAAPEATPAPATKAPPAVEFNHLTRAQQRTAITRLAKDYDDPAAHKEFATQFGPAAYTEAKALAEKLRKSMAF